MASNSAAHTALVNDLLVEISKRPFVRVWPVVVGKFRMLRDPERIVSVGRVGQADISGIILISGKGIRLEIEVKTGSAVQTVEQKAYQAMITKLGGIYIVARDIKKTLEFIDGAINV